ncbi:hypothetical protein [Roseobacter litoralis]|uniref:Abi-like protein n=1 Tax=Roseobacter litoralis (strain ATCC 49566 / DSM 6996 / JCM 21268 / NBRC 15278 / OCh 149) TaxID=391595 RepID=F7ZAQ8_ROSLO|nr:hypothetical protein [Roseobacter litoralis]AEI94254.1 hypothetical protein RLO149_c022810 [Roseobacter litoralis Och 149]
MSEDPKVDPQAEGFRQPPDHTTDPCLTYMARIMELREFVGFYFGFVKTSQEMGKAIEDQKEKEEFKVFEYNFSNQRPLVNQVMLSRATESFDLYLTTILRDIFLARPEMLKSDSKIDVSTIIETGNYEDLIWQIVERKVHELSYKPLRELRKFISSRTGIEIFPSEEAFEITLIASEIRNLIAHNDCVVNDLFKTRTKDVEFPLKISDTGRVEIEDDWLRRASYTLDSIVFDFDERASKKFDLHTRYRFGAFTIRS